MKIKAAVIAAALMVSVGIASAQESRATWDWNDRFSYDSEGDRFMNQEFSLDVFGSYFRGANEWDDIFDDADGGRWGGGLGVNYFFHRYVGVGVDASVHANGGAFVDHVNTSVIARFPIDAISMAPYVFGGGGRMFDPSDKWSLHAGLGIEFRLNPRTGLFIDGRHAWGEDSTDYTLIRSGLRFAF